MGKRKKNIFQSDALKRVLGEVDDDPYENLDEKEEEAAANVGVTYINEKEEEK